MVLTANVPGSSVRCEMVEPEVAIPIATPIRTMPRSVTPQTARYNPVQEYSGTDCESRYTIGTITMPAMVKPMPNTISWFVGGRSSTIFIPSTGCDTSMIFLPAARRGEEKCLASLC